MKNKKILQAAAGITVLLLLLKYSDRIFQLLSLLLSLSMPLILGCATAYILNILVSGLEKLPVWGTPVSRRYRSRRVLSILGSLLIIAAVILLLIIIIIPQLADAFRVIIWGIPPTLSKCADWVLSQNIPFPQLETWIHSLDVNWPQLIQKVTAYFTSGMGNVVNSALSVVSSLGSLAVQMSISFIFALYLLAGKERLSRQLISLAAVYLKKNTRKKIRYVLLTAHDTFTRFFVGQFTEAVIIGVLCAAGMWILRFPYAPMIGTLIGATALIPVVGAYLGAFIGAFMILTVSPLQAAGFLVFIVILQQLEGNLIYPRVVGTSVGLPGIWVLAAVTIGGGVGGIAGILLAVPTTATLYRLLQNDVRKKKAEEEIPLPPEHHI